MKQTVSSPPQVLLSQENEVLVDEILPVNTYKSVATQQEFNQLKSLSEELHQAKVMFINATPQGGGVAIMRQSLIRLFKAFGMKVSWHVLQPDPEMFLITKRKFHNVLQGVSPPSVKLTATDKKNYKQWILQNALFFDQVFARADIVVFDDMQTAGLIPYVKEHYPQIKIVYRSHIQIATELVRQPGSPQAITWDFLWEFIKEADVFVSHPVAEFVPHQVPPGKLVFMPPSTDPLSDLNRPLSEAEINKNLKLFNSYLKETKQKPLDLSKPYMVQIARFDPSKGIPDVLEAFAKLTLLLQQQKIEPPQLVITGNASIDDPDGVPVLSQTLELATSEPFKPIRDLIKVIQLPPNDALLNALLRKSYIALQLSHREGFEFKVTEALMKGIPVVAYRAGGIPLQIKDGVNGYLVSIGDVDVVAEHLFELMTDQEKYQAMSRAAAQHFDKNFLTIPNAIAWMVLWQRLRK